MSKYFALVTNTGDLRLVYVGEFDCIGRAIEKAENKYSYGNVIWLLSEADARVIIRDFEIAIKQ